MNMQRYARIAGVLFLVSLVAGGFGEAYVPSKIIVSGDAAVTAANIRNFEFLYRLGFAGFLIESLCDITLVLIMYALPVKSRAGCACHIMLRNHSPLVIAIRGAGVRSWGQGLARKFTVPSHDGREDLGVRA